MTNRLKTFNELDKVLDSIVNPIYINIYELFSGFIKRGMSDEELEKQVKDLLSLAIFKGTELADGYSDKLDDASLDAIKKLDKSVIIQQKQKNFIAKLNMLNRSGVVNRFVSPLDYDENGNYKGGK